MDATPSDAAATAPVCQDEAARLDALERHRIIGTDREDAYDALTRLAAQVLSAPFAALGFVQETRVWFKSHLGLERAETPRERSFCAHAILGRTALVVRDALADPRFVDHPLVRSEPGIRFYAGASIWVEGHALGVLSVMDTISRAPSAEEVAALEALARQAAALLELRRRKLDIAALETRLERLKGESHLLKVAAAGSNEAETLDRAVRDSELRFRSVFQSAQDGIVLADRDGKVVAFNEAAQKMFGHEESEVLGRPLALLMPERYRGSHLAGIARFDPGRASQVVGKTLELHGLTKHGKEFPIELSVATWTTDQERFFAGIIRDITARKRSQAQLLTAEQQLRARTVSLERRNAALSEFAGIASHDLKEPLWRIRSFGRRLQESCGSALGEEGRDFLTRILNASGKMEDLIQALLSYSRALEQPRNLVEVDLGELAREVLSDLEARVEECGAIVEIADLPRFEVDPTHMRQVFQNLIGNALKFRVEGRPPRVRVYGRLIAASEPGGSSAWQLCIEDNGIGFDEQYLPALFKPFERLHPRQYEGTGMGLAICEKIISSYGGSITATSRPGDGSTFRITLPIAGPDPGAGRV